jgi:hypothetical protein
MDLDLPTRRKATDSSFSTKPEVVREWVDNLPLINTEKSRVMLEDALTEINSLSIPTRNRHESLELLATSVMCVTDTMKKAFLGRPIPLNDNDLLLARQTVQLCNQMATGYRILADDSGKDDNQAALLTLAIHRALRYLSELLLTNYQIYIQYPGGLWKTINSLYALAEQHDITSHPVTDSTLSTAAQSTISTVYKQILLMSLACPYRLRQKEIHFVYNALMDWADIAQLHHMESDQSGGLFAVNLRADKPPSYRSLIDGETQDPHWRVLDTTSMADRIRSILELQPDERRKIGIGDTNILQRLMLAWGAMPKRRFSRHTRTARVCLVAGLNAVHECITSPAAETETGEDQIGDQHYLQDPTFEATTTFKTNPFNAGGQRIVTAGKTHGKPRDNTQQADSARIESWTMANFSAGGYSLLWDSTDSSSAQVGELVAIIEEDKLNEDEWQLGVVRWMKCTDSNGLELGIQMLSPSAQAVWTSLYESSLHSGKKMRSIMLPEISMLRQQASLILPTLPFRPGCTATLQAAGSMENIKLTHQLENTGSFAQYHFTTAIND